MNRVPESPRLQKLFLTAPLMAALVTTVGALPCRTRPLPGGTAADAPPSAAPAQKSGATADPIRYTGPGSCSSTSCHGSVKPRAETRVLQDEYSTWVVKDKHARAYAALTGAVGQRMGRILGLGKAETAQKCLACHALSIPEAQRAKTFGNGETEGVSCESCHGPASAWLGPHTTKDWTHEKSLAAGMYDTRDVIKRTERCLSCHLGNQEKFVDHEMIAAGHPDLYFELDSFSAVMPRHWNEPRQVQPGAPAENDPLHGVREWSTGQAVQLRLAMERLAGRARGKVWPEYAELQCFACHHILTPPEQSWRQERGYPGRRPGDPPFNPSRSVVFRELVHQVDGEAAKRLDAELNKVFEQMSKLNPDRDAVAASATATAGVAERLAQRLATMPYDAALTLRVMQRIFANADDIAGQGERAAEQAVMALDSLFITYSRNAKVDNAAEVRAAINALFQQVENPSSYNPATFARQMRKVGALLR